MIVVVVIRVSIVIRVKLDEIVCVVHAVSPSSAGADVVSVARGIGYPLTATTDARASSFARHDRNA